MFLPLNSCQPLCPLVDVDLIARLWHLVRYRIRCPYHKQVVRSKSCICCIPLLQFSSSRPRDPGQVLPSSMISIGLAVKLLVGQLTTGCLPAISQFASSKIVSQLVVIARSLIAVLTG